MDNNEKVSPILAQNITSMEHYFHDCADIKKKQLTLGKDASTACYLTFIEVSVDMGTSALGETLKYLNSLSKQEIQQVLAQNAIGITDATYFDTIPDAVNGLLR